MAQFRIGDKVKVVSAHEPMRRSAAHRLAKEGTVVVVYETGTFPIGVNFGGYDYMVFQPCELAPLLPPDEAADAFLARLKKLGSEPVNDAPKVKVGAK